MSDNLTPTCRACRVPALANGTGEQIELIACPSCGVELRGDAARQMIREHGAYYMGKAFDGMMRNAMRGAKNVRYVPGDLHDPGGPFILTAIEEAPNS